MPEAIVMKTFRDYGPEYSWFAYCSRCFHKRAFSAADIAGRIGLDAEVDQVRRRLRCSACGACDCWLYRYYNGGMDGPGLGAYSLTLVRLDDIDGGERMGTTPVEEFWN